MRNVSEFLLNYLKKKTKLFDGESDNQVLVVPYESYRHEYKMLKDASRKDISSLIKFTRDNLLGEQSVLYDVIQSSEHTVVHFYFFKNEWLKQNATKAIFIFPLCWLIGKGMPSCSLRQFDGYFVSRVENGTFLTARTAILNSSSVVAEANGIAPSKVDHVRYTTNELIDQGLNNISVLELRRFLNPLLLRKLKHLDYRPALICSILVFALYLGATSLFFGLKLAELDSEISDLSPKASGVIRASGALKSKASSINEIHDLLGQRNFTLPIWLALQPVYEDEARLHFIRYSDDGKFRVGIEANNAIALINSLSESKWTQSVKLDGEVSSKNDKERFDVIIKLSREHLDET